MDNTVYMLDLDGTLVHSVMSRWNNNTTNNHPLPIDTNIIKRMRSLRINSHRWIVSNVERSSPIYNKQKHNITRFKDNYMKINVRPGTHQLIESINNSGATIIVWSAGTPDYVDTVVSHLNIKPQRVYNRTHMIELDGRLYKSMTSKGYNFSNTIIIEDNPHMVMDVERCNVITVTPWEAYKHWDNELYILSSAIDKGIIKVRQAPQSNIYDIVSVQQLLD